MEAMRNVRDVIGTGSGEGDPTKMIESQTLGSHLAPFLTVAVGAMALSALMMLLGKRNVANFVGQ